MAKRNQIRCLLRAHDGSNTCNRQNVSLLGVSLFHQSKSLGMHADPAFGDADAVCLIFISNIHHMGFARLVEMSQLGHINTFLELVTAKNRITVIFFLTA